jgi:8-oxo-dGTP pyrophosphatase MutT (NUDIX family)
MNRSERLPFRKGLGSAAAIFDARKRILLVKQTYGRLNWELPGGLADGHESPIETVVREVHEEIGLEVEVKSLAAWYYEPAEDLVHFVFRCDPRPLGTVPSADMAEISEWGYWPVTDLPGPISDFTIRRIHDSTSGNNVPMPAIVGPRQWLE